MDIGTPFCPDHRDLKIPPFKTECQICNRTLLLWKDEYKTNPAQIAKDFKLPKKPEVKAKGPDVWAKPEPPEAPAHPRTFAELRDIIEARIEEAKKEKTSAEAEAEEKKIVGKRLAELDKPNPIDHDRLIGKLKDTTKEKIEAKAVKEPKLFNEPFKETLKGYTAPDRATGPKAKEKTEPYKPLRKDEKTEPFRKSKK